MLSPEGLDALEGRVDGWFRREAGRNPMIDAVERGERGERRWWAYIVQVRPTRLRTGFISKFQ